MKKLNVVNKLIGWNKLNARGQGALEYILIIGGAVLVAAVVIGILLSTTKDTRQDINASQTAVDDVRGQAGELLDDVLGNVVVRDPADLTGVGGTGGTGTGGIIVGGTGGTGTGITGTGGNTDPCYILTALNNCDVKNLKCQNNQSVNVCNATITNAYKCLDGSKPFCTTYNLITNPVGNFEDLKSLGVIALNTLNSNLTGEAFILESYNNKNILYTSKICYSEINGKALDINVYALVENLRVDYNVCSNTCSIVNDDKYTTNDLYDSSYKLFKSNYLAKSNESIKGVCISSEDNSKFFISNINIYRWIMPDPESYQWVTFVNDSNFITTGICDDVSCSSKVLLNAKGGSKYARFISLCYSVGSSNYDRQYNLSFDYYVRNNNDINIIINPGNYVWDTLYRSEVWGDYNKSFTMASNKNQICIKGFDESTFIDNLSLKRIS